MSEADDDDSTPLVPAPDAAVLALRERAKAHFPNVLLTLTSIIQALALEMLWSEVSDQVAAVGVVAIPTLVWLQAAALLMIIILLWVYYAQLVMRLVWVPRIADSLVPFAFGLAEFFLADCIGTEPVFLWMLPLAPLFLLSLFSWNATLDHAGAEPENAALIARFIPDAALDRYGPMLGNVAILAVLTLLTWLWPVTVVPVLVLVNALMLLQLVMQGMYWRNSMGL